MENYGIYFRSASFPVNLMIRLAEAANGLKDLPPTAEGMGFGDQPQVSFGRNVGDLGRLLHLLADGEMEFRKVNIYT